MRSAQPAIRSARHQASSRAGQPASRPARKPRAGQPDGSCRRSFCRVAQPDSRPCRSRPRHRPIASRAECAPRGRSPTRMAGAPAPPRWWWLSRARSHSARSDSRRPNSSRFRPLPPPTTKLDHQGTSGSAADPADLVHPLGVCPQGQRSLYLGGGLRPLGKIVGQGEKARTKTSVGRLQHPAGSVCFYKDRLPHLDPGHIKRSAFPWDALPGRRRTTPRTSSGSGGTSSPRPAPGGGWSGTSWGPSFCS